MKIQRDPMNQPGRVAPGGGKRTPSDPSPFSGGGTHAVPDSVAVMGLPEPAGAPPTAAVQEEATPLDPAWSLFLEQVDDETRSSADKARDILTLLRQCDGQGGPSSYAGRVVTLKAPVDLPPLPVCADDMLAMMGSVRGLLRSTKRVELPAVDGVTFPMETAIDRWASGAGSEGSRAFVDPLVEAWVRRLFEAAQERLGVYLSHTDLFHGHVRRDDTVHPPDVLIVFHAREFPSGLDEYTQSRHDLATGSGLGASFETDTPEYAKRNLVFSMRAARLWQVDTSEGSGFNHLVRSELYDSGVIPNDLVLRANTAQESYLGSPVCDMNYFPRVFERPFINVTGC